MRIGGVTTSAVHGRGIAEADLPDATGGQQAASLRHPETLGRPRLSGYCSAAEPGSCESRSSLLLPRLTSIAAFFLIGSYV